MPNLPKKMLNIVKTFTTMSFQSVKLIIILHGYAW